MLVRLFVFFGSLVVLALCAALVGPYFVDWTSYRSDFEREASAILGRKVEVRGDAEARLLPFPSIAFSDVVVSGANGDAVLTAEKFAMYAELAPFLSGDVHIFDMQVERPKVEIKARADGTIDWAVRPSTPVDPRHISIEKLTVVEGQVRVADEGSGRILALTEINADVSARSLAGPWRVSGSLRANGQPAVIEASAGTVNVNGLPLKLSVTPDAFPVKVEAEGNATAKDGALAYAGTFRVAGVKPVVVELRDGDGKAQPGADMPPNRLTGAFKAGSDRLDVESFRFETGPIADPYVAEGSGFIDIGGEPRFSVVANGAQIRLDDSDEAEGATITLAERLQQFGEMLAAIPQPQIPGTVDVSLPAVVTGSTTIRDVNLAAEPEGGAWRIKSASALLPGRSTLEASGLLAGGDTPHFDGDLLLAVKQPTGFAAWLSNDVDAAIRRLPALGFRATVALDSQSQRFDNLEMILGAAKLTGQVERMANEGQKPYVAAKLTGAAMDGDTALALISLLTGKDNQSRLAGHDIDFELKGGPVSAFGLLAASIDTALRLKDNRLDIDRLAIGDMAGASLSATGTVRDLGGAPIGDLDATLTAGDLAPFVAELAARFPDNALVAQLAERASAAPELFGETRLDIVSSVAQEDGKAPSSAFSIKGLIGQSKLSATLSGGLDAFAGTSPFSASGEIDNEDSVALLGLIGLPTVPLADIGKGRIDFDLVGALASGVKTTISLNGEGFVFSFGGDSQRQGANIILRGKSSLQAQDIEPWLMTVGWAMPGMGLGTNLSATADIDFGNDLLVISNLTGLAGKADFSGDLNVAFGASVPAISGALTLDELDFEQAAGLVFGAPALVSADGVAWPDQPFQTRPVAPFSSDLTLTVDVLEAGPLPQVNKASFDLQLDGTQLRLANISGEALGAQISGLVELKNESGAGLLSSQLTATSADISTLLAGFGLANESLSGAADISASVTSNGKSIEAMAAAMSGTGVATLEGLAIKGLNDAALPQLIAASDQIGRDIDAASIDRFAPGAIRKGTYKAGNARFAFNVASGVVRMPATRFDSGKAALTVEARVDVAQQQLEGEAELAYDAGIDGQAGSEPTVRFLLTGPVGAPAVTLDSQPLAQFLTQRQLELEQARVEAMQAAIMEKQRLRREVAHFSSLKSKRLAFATEEAHRRAETVRLFGEVEAARKQAEAEAAKKAAAEEVKRKAAEEEAQKAAAEAEAKRKATEEAAQKAAAEAEAKRKAAEVAAQKAAAEAEAKRKAAEEAAQKAAAEAETKRKAAEVAAQKAAAEEEKKKATEEARKKAEQEAAKPKETPKPEPQPKPAATVEPAPKPAPKPAAIPVFPPAPPPPTNSSSFGDLQFDVGR